MGARWCEARQPTRCCFVIGQVPIRQPLVGASLVGARWGPGAAHHNRRASEVSSCRTPIRHPRWCTGQGAATPKTHETNKTFDPETLCRGVSRGRPMGWGSATTKPRGHQRTPHSSSSPTPIGDPAARAWATPSHQPRSSARRTTPPFVLPDSDPAPTVGRGLGRGNRRDPMS